MFIKFIEYIGNKTITYSLSTYDFFLFLFQSIWNIFLVKNYTKLSRVIFVEQIYLSAIKNLFFFVFLALSLGSILLVFAIDFAISFNLFDQIGKLLVLFIVNEFSPFFTSIYFMLVHGLSLQEKIEKRKNDKKVLNSKIYIPKLITGLFIVPLMALLFATIMMISGYIVSSLYLSIDLNTYQDMIINSIDFNNILILLIKVLFLVFFVFLFPFIQDIKKR